MKKEIIGKHYVHIDNGGFEIEINEVLNEDNQSCGAEIEFSNSFYGYATNKMILHVGKNARHIGPNDLREIAELFNNSADILEGK